MNKTAYVFWLVFAAFMGVLSGFGVSRLAPAWAGGIVGLVVFALLIGVANVCLRAGAADRQEEEAERVHGGLEER